MPCHTYVFCFITYIYSMHYLTDIKYLNFLEKNAALPCFDILNLPPENTPAPTLPGRGESGTEAS